MEQINIAVYGLDDNPDDLFAIERIIVKRGVKSYHLFTNKEEFLKALKEGIHVVILDHNLPVGTGLEILQDIKKKNKETFAIGLNVVDDPAILKAYIRAGIDDWVDKNDSDYLEQLDESLTKGLEAATGKVRFYQYMMAQVKAI